jgi:hypothetical protein
MASDLARARAQIQSIRRRGAELETQIVRKAVISITAAGQGFAESKGLQVSYFGVPTKLGLATLGSLAQLLTRDATTNRFLGAFADAQLAAYAYEASKLQAFIAGDDGGGPV